MHCEPFVRNHRSDHLPNECRARDRSSDCSRVTVSQFCQHLRQIARRSASYWIYAVWTLSKYEQLDARNCNCLQSCRNLLTSTPTCSTPSKLQNRGNHVALLRNFNRAQRLRFMTSEAPVCRTPLVLCWRKRTR